MQQRRIEVIRGFLKQKSWDNILIAGCGSQADMFIPADGNIRIGGISCAFDLSYNGAKIARSAYSKNEYLTADAQTLPFKNNSFNCIICSEVIEHLPYPEKAVSEFHRVLADKGRLIITTPNWHSWYGIARRAAELCSGKPVTSANQPIDNWYTYSRLSNLLKDKFDILNKCGIWYFPPTGRGMKVIPAEITVPIYKLFTPFERILEKITPKLGHMLAVYCVKR